VKKAAFQNNPFCSMPLGILCAACWLLPDPTPISNNIQDKQLRRQNSPLDVEIGISTYDTAFLVDDDELPSGDPTVAAAFGSSLTQCFFQISESEIHRLPFLNLAIPIVEIAPKQGPPPFALFS
jgi:hypothetical protein